jgi:dissimilatory sulfite reductase (desulfoviridin) alpha/beta subunit
VGPKPRIGKELITGLNDDQVIEAVATVVDYYQEQAKKGERLGKMLERVGIEPFQNILA